MWSATGRCGLATRLVAGKPASLVVVRPAAMHDKFWWQCNCFSSTAPARWQSRPQSRRRPAAQSAPCPPLQGVGYRQRGAVVASQLRPIGAFKTIKCHCAHSLALGCTTSIGHHHIGLTSSPAHPAAAPPASGSRRRPAPRAAMAGGQQRRGPPQLPHTWGQEGSGWRLGGAKYPVPCRQEAQKLRLGNNVFNGCVHN